MRIQLAFGVIASLLVMGCGRDRAPEPVPARAIRTSAARAEVTRGATPYAGGLEPAVKLDLTFGVPGRVRAIGTRRDGASLHEGDEVTKGQILAQLDDADLKRQAASAWLASSSAAGEIDAANAAAVQADADLERVKKLASSGTISASEVEKAETANKTARARVDAIRAQHSAKLEQYAIARRVEGDARLSSPIDGVIARRMIDPGENVGGATIAFTVIDTRQMKLVFAVPDARISAVKLGQLVPVHTDALPGTPFVGRVATIHPVADPALRTFAVELSIDNADGKLRAGMVASAALGEGALLVPLASIVRAPNGAVAVFVVDGRRAALRPVTLGDLVGNDVEVAAGVKDGERVVTDGAALLHDGEDVEVLP
jgi:RND family efflux transporter MFP subunit